MTYGQKSLFKGNFIQRLYQNIGADNLKIYYINYLHIKNIP